MIASSINTTENTINAITTTIKIKTRIKIVLVDVTGAEDRYPHTGTTIVAGAHGDAHVCDATDDHESCLTLAGGDESLR
jgi:hypothetical protein